MKRTIAWLRLLRIFPTFAWVGSSTVVGFSIAARQIQWSNLDFGAFLLVVVSGVVCHGLLSHSANDLVDWSSGTDQTSPGLFSGGSRVVADGYLTVENLSAGIYTAALGGCILMIVLFTRLGSSAFIAGVIGISAAAFYSLPPLRLSYRPFLGEWFAACLALVTCAWVTTLAASRGLAAPHREWALIIATATTLISHLMFHHLSDIEADLKARPRKLTTPAFAVLRGRDPRMVAVIYWAGTAGLCLVNGLVLLGSACLVAAASAKSANLSDKKNLARMDKLLLAFLTVFIFVEAIY